MKLFGYRVIAASSPRMTAQDTLASKVKAFERAMQLDSIYSVSRASRSETARWWRDRGDARTIKIDRKE